MGGMALQILNQPDDVQERIQRAIEEAIEGARVEVRSASPGHFEIRVVSGAFEGRSRVRQQQMVYAAITPLMSGDAPPVHAIDRLETLTG
jgi:acid stress-induced BolA-like protein IbaG/YrbA